jgi:hypothetical protein
MLEHYTPHKEVESSRHPVLPDSEDYRITRIQQDMRLDGGESTMVLHLCHRYRGVRRVLRFSGVDCRHELAGNCSLYIINIGSRCWEGLKIEVGEYFESKAAYFHAADVQDITGEWRDEEA